MTPMSLDRTTLTERSGSLILSEMAARKPALPPPRTRIRWIIGFCLSEGARIETAPLAPAECLHRRVPARRRCRGDLSAGGVADGTGVELGVRRCRFSAAVLRTRPRV